ncbi:MAG: hypothetical protein COS85_17265 [Armatimonadetes bacterium CG07_land_8_20_14_0_80_59_28]|nr:MAG: hypothetical protein COS85_17265 [Armatimonadetes bacterium CG07_land_8_20_14_0_80_59_28]PIY39007.1 MAG: hypothetical protein COZ05_19835 [Armatimonadetes bacterium CG_4_10_14_3_um_filter_59_10]PJB62759.1 MAG: hypothetical protein CO095_17955 [Armatimonadetes bacterium CG_4_9_14_3_um_filter_58_7]
MKVICLAPSGRTILFGAFVPGALPQAMLCQSFGLKDIIRNVKRLYGFTCSGAMLCQAFGLEEDTITSVDVVCVLRNKRLR